MNYVFAPFESIADAGAFALFLLVFPVYHAVYPHLAHRWPAATALGRIERYRRSWIERTLERGDVITAVQQTRNLTMVNSLLASSALILLAFTASNILPFLEATPAHENAARVAKLSLLLFVLAVAFSYFAVSLRSIGHFNLLVGTDPKLLDAEEGSAVDYLSRLIARASSASTLGIRAFYSAFPLLLWVFDAWLCIAATLIWAVKYVGFRDFRTPR